MNNFRHPGDTVVMTAPAALASGAGALLGSIFGVAKTAIASGVKGPFQVTGVVNLPKATGAITEGQLLYWDNTNKVVTTTVGSNKLIGACVIAAASGDAAVDLRLNGAFIS